MSGLSQALVKHLCHAYSDCEMMMVIIITTDHCNKLSSQPEDLQQENVSRKDITSDGCMLGTVLKAVIFTVIILLLRNIGGG